MSASIRSHQTAIIAEHKRRSPSKGEIAPCSSAPEIVAQYEAGGAAAVSVLTDTRFFGGSLSDLAQARVVAKKIPLLRKDFIIDSYQIHEARVFGADAILLIATILSAEELKSLNDEAHAYGLEALVEVHDEEDLSKISFEPDLLGVNSRNLRCFDTSLNVAESMASLLSFECPKIAESGVKSSADIRMLKSAGYSGFLIGEALMSTADPGQTLKQFIDESAI